MKLRAWPLLFLAATGPFCLSQRTRQLSPDLNPEPFGSEFRVEPTKPITIAELEKILAENKNTGDKKLSAMLSGYSLTERAASIRMSRWIAASPGSRTGQTLIALADGAAFLPLPAEDTPIAPAPSVNEQRRMIAQLDGYLKDTLPALPNFVATRHTIYFEDGPTRQLPLFSHAVPVDPMKNLPVHLVGTSDLQVSYFDGHEVIRKREAMSGFDPYSTRLSTSGEFGAILYGVAIDAANNKLTGEVGNKAKTAWSPSSVSIPRRNIPTTPSALRTLQNPSPIPSPIAEKSPSILLTDPSCGSRSSRIRPRTLPW
jgi:hypothetical protein